MCVRVCYWLLSEVKDDDNDDQRAILPVYMFGHRKSTTRFLASHRRTVYVAPKSPKGWLKTKIVTFIVALHFFVAGNRRHFKFNMWVEHSESQPTDDKMPLKWALPRHVTHFKFLVPPKIFLERLKLKTSNLVCMLIVASPSLQTTNCLWKGRGHCHVTSLIFGK